MKKAALSYIVCPFCLGRLELIEEEICKDNVMRGSLECRNKGCGNKYPVVHGLADLCRLRYEEESAVAESFGFEWGAHHQKKMESASVFGREPDEDISYFQTAMNVTGLEGKLVLDAGCGSGTLTRLIAQLSPRFVFGTDINTATGEGERLTHEVPNCEIVRADIFNLPFPPGSFDVVWCNGVLHHTPNPRHAFRRLASMVKPGGVLYVWVYERRLSPFNLTKDLFRLTRLDRLPHKHLFQICRVLSVASCALHGAYRFVGAATGISRWSKSERLKQSLRYRSFGEFLLTWFDSLSPRYDSRHSKTEVAEWFESNGFQDLQYYPYQVGIRGIRR